MNKFLSYAKVPPGFWTYIQPETGHTEKSSSFDYLLNVLVASHRVLFHLDLSDGWKDRAEDEMTFYNDAPSKDRPVQTQLERYGRKLWKELHDFASSYSDEPSPAETAEYKEWFSKWEARIPFRACLCKDTWTEVRKHWEPDWTSRKTLMVSCVIAHNQINLKLGKPIWTT